MHRSAVLSRALAFGLLVAPLLAHASHALPPLALSQRNTDGSPLCAGCTTTSGPEVDITAASDPATCGGSYVLEIEVRTVGSSFSGVPTHSSAPMVKPGCSQVTYPLTRISGLSSGVSYKWQVRERTGSVGAWVAFNNGNVG